MIEERGERGSVKTAESEATLILWEQGETGTNVNNNLNRDKLDSTSKT